MIITRRQFAITATAAALVPKIARANPLGLPLGIQLFSVREQMAKDLDGALAGVRDAGFTEIEAAALPKKPAREIRAAFDKAGLKCVSSHIGFNDLLSKFDETVDFQKELGVKFVVCPGPGRPTTRTAGAPSMPMSIDDWRWNADQFNIFGDKLAPLGVRLAYHNHTGEFANIDGKTPYLELLAHTDPRKVSFEMDCGWVIVGGYRPVELMKQFPHRFTMLHVKDFNLPADKAMYIKESRVTELGKGSIDYKPVFAQAARNQHIEHAFVEQEAFDLPWKDSLKLDAEYMRSLK